MKSVFIKTLFLGAVIFDWYELTIILNVFFCVERIINCLSNDQKYTPPNFS